MNHVAHIVDADWHRRLDFEQGAICFPSVKHVHGCRESDIHLAAALQAQEPVEQFCEASANVIGTFQVELA